MLHFFPIPYPDELFYSVLCRYHIRSGNRNFRQTQLDLFETEGTKQYYLGLPSNLATLINKLPFGSNFTVNQLLENHTLFPYYRSILSSGEVKRLRELMGGKESKSIAQVAKIPKLKLYYPEYLQFCSQCLQKDLDYYGEAYWRRMHQVPGVKVCLNHRVVLENSNVLVDEIGKRFVPAGVENCVPYGIGYEVDILHRLCEFGNLVEEEMRQARSVINLKNLRDKYKNSLVEQGLLDEKKLAEALLNEYGEKVLRIIHPEMMDNLGEYVSGCLLGCDLVPDVDRVVHWLFKKISIY